MANAVLHRVWAHSQARGAERCLLLALADVADQRGIAYPGVPYLAEMIRETPDYTDKLIKKLVERGELFKIAGAGRGHVTRFAVLCGLSDLQQEQIKGVLKNPFSNDKKGHDGTPIHSDKRGTPRARKGVLPSDKRGTLLDTKQASFEALERAELPIGQKEIQHDPDHDPVGVGDRARVENVLVEAGIYPATIKQILALNIDPPTLITSVDTLVAAKWGPSAIADRLRLTPPPKGQPYEHPNQNGRPVQPDVPSNRARRAAPGAQRYAATLTDTPAWMAEQLAGLSDDDSEV